MNTALSVLVVSPPSPVWGAQIYLLDQVEALASRGVVLTLGSPNDSPFTDEWCSRGFPHRKIDIRPHQGLRVPGSERRPGPRALVRMARDVAHNMNEIRRVVADYDVAYSFALRTHLEATVACRVARVPVGLDLVDLVRPGVGRRLLGVTSRLADVTVANSSATAAVLPKRSRVKVIHPGIDLERFAPGPAPGGLRRELSGGADVPLVGIAGRLDECKGVQILVEAMRQTRGCAAAAKLVVVGDVGTGPPEFADGLRRDAKVALGDRVNFVGRRGDMPDVMRALDVLVVASRSEPFGLTALEAQACRTPVIGTDAGGLPEFVIDGVTGLLVPPFEPEPMARAIERILEDRALRVRLVAEAERRARPARGLEAQYDEIAQMYRDVASGASRG